MQNKERFLIPHVLIIFLAIISFTLPYIVAKIQDNRISSSTITVNLEKLKSDNVMISDTTDLNLIYDIITNGEKKVVDFNYYNEPFPSQLIVGVNEELALLEHYRLLPDNEFELIDTPILLEYSIKSGVSILVWEYYFVDTNKNIMKLYYHSKTNRIISLEYEIDNPDKYGDVSISIFATVGYIFDYIPTVLAEIIDSKETIKTTITLKESCYEIYIYSR